MYELCKSLRIILRSSIYNGITYPDPRKLCQLGPTFMKLLNVYLAEGYTVYVDNFYNSVWLTKYELFNPSQYLYSDDEEG